MVTTRSATQSKGKGKAAEEDPKGQGHQRSAAGSRRIGCLMLFSGDYAGKGEDNEYWRRRLGWFGEKKPRAVFYRYEASGDPTRSVWPIPDGRFSWALELGEWVPKEDLEEVLEEAARQRNAGRSRGRGRPRGSGRKAGVEQPAGPVASGSRGKGKATRVCKRGKCK